MEVVGMRVEKQKIRKISERTEKKRGEMLVVGLKNQAQKRERISEDLSWGERKIRWRLGDIARKEKVKGKRVWVKGNRIWIEGQWWRWDEEREELIGED